MPEAGDAERLVVLLEARIRDFEKNMAKASGTATRSYGRMRKDSRSASRAMERDVARSSSRINQAWAATSARIGTVGRAAFAGVALGATATLAPILSIVGALNGAKAALSEFDKIGKAAKASGLDAEFFQELQYSAELGGVGVDQLSQALNAFNRNAGMAAIGKGELVEKLKLLHPELLKNIAAATSQEERLRLVADALAKETDASRKAAIAAAAFGDAGVKMVEVLKGGSAALDETARKARQMGLIVDRHLIANAETLNDEFSTATKILDLQFKQALVNLAPVLVGIAERAARLAGDIRWLIDSMKELENQSSQSLTSGARDNDRERLEIENKILALRQEQREITGATAVMEIRFIDGTIKALEERLAGLTDKGATIETILKTRRESQPPLSPIDTGADIPEIGGSGGSRNKAAEAAIREAEAVKELIATLQAERSEIGMTNAEKRTAQALRQAGSAATADERAQIAALISEIEAETAALEANERAQEQRKQAIEGLFQMGGDALSSIVDGSLKAEEAIKRLAVQLALAAAQAALLGTGPLAGLFGGGGGSLFGGSAFKPNTSFAGFLGLPGFASGTADTGGMRGQPRGIVHGREAVIPLPDGGKVPVRIEGGGGGETRVKVDVGVSVDRDGNLQAFVRDVSQKTTQAGLSSYDKGRQKRYQAGGQFG